MKIGLFFISVLLALTVVAHAQESDSHSRSWGFGYDDNLTLRHQMGRWQLAVTAGPNDSLRDRDTHSTGPDYPDSLQGLQTRDNLQKQESGTVRLDILRDLASQDNFVFSGLLGGGYTWSDNEYRESYYHNYLDDSGYSESWDTWFVETWDVALGGRLAWHPVPMVSLEAKFGLGYRWSETQKMGRHKDLDETEWSVSSIHTEDKSTYSFGFYSLISDLQLIVWF